MKPYLHLLCHLGCSSSFAASRPMQWHLLVCSSCSGDFLRNDISIIASRSAEWRVGCISWQPPLALLESRCCHEVGGRGRMTASVKVRFHWNHCVFGCHPCFHVKWNQTNLLRWSGLFHLSGLLILQLKEPREKCPVTHYMGCILTSLRNWLISG